MKSKKTIIVPQEMDERLKKAQYEQFELSFRDLYDQSLLEHILKADIVKKVLKEHEIREIDEFLNGLEKLLE